jgi:hypothetical protein
MENKYFVPDIEDLHVGYELETEVHDFLKGFSWESVIIDVDTISSVCKSYKHIKVRVPYLTKEQLEAEGWKEYKLNDNEQAFGLYKKSGYNLRFYENNIYCFSELMVGRGMEDCWDKILYEGECKDINTFRKICKLLNIK